MLYKVSPTSCDSLGLASISDNLVWGLGLVWGFFATKTDLVLILKLDKFIKFHML